MQTDRMRLLAFLRECPRLRFSFWLLALICVALGWYVAQVERQKRAVEWVRRNRGLVFYNHELDSKGELILNTQPPGPQWLLELIAVDCFARVVEIEHRKSGASPQQSLIEFKTKGYCLCKQEQVACSSTSHLIKAFNLD